jgi:hypothetical protein
MLLHMPAGKLHDRLAITGSVIHLGYSRAGDCLELESCKLVEHCFGVQDGVCGHSKTAVVVSVSVSVALLLYSGYIYNYPPNQGWLPEFIMSPVNR